MDIILDRIFHAVREIALIQLGTFKTIDTWATLPESNSPSSSTQIARSAEAWSSDELNDKLIALLIHFHPYDVQLILHSMERAKLTAKQLQNVMHVLTRNDDLANVLHQRSKLYVTKVHFLSEI